MFGRKDDTEPIRAALAAADCDMAAFGRWRKQYERVIKRRKEERQRYARCRELTEQVQTDAELLERQLAGNDAPDARECARLLKELGQMKGQFYHEFLVSRRDTEFSSTYDAILGMGVRALGIPQERLLLQSETENLLALVRENLEKEAPRPEELAFYYMGGSDDELAELPPAERLARIRKRYEDGFCQPILSLLEAGIARAKQQEKAADSGRKKEALSFLLGQDAAHVLEQIMTEQE